MLRYCSTWGSDEHRPFQNHTVGISINQITSSMSIIHESFTWAVSLGRGGVMTIDQDVGVYLSICGSWPGTPYINIEDHQV